MSEVLYERARQSRDPRFDGRFFVAVKTTGIYCRPICPAVTPKRRNVEFYDTAAAAAEAGFRPCLRCRPEAAPGSPAWNGTSTTVRRGLRLIAGGALDEAGVPALAARLGVTDRHLRRLFQKHLGASPQAVAQTQRLHFAKRLIDDTTLPMADVALAAGFGSTRRFNDAVKRTWQRSPRELRKLHGGGDSETLKLLLPYRKPYDWQKLAAFFGARAIAGVESVEAGVYRRVVPGESGPGVVEVSDTGSALEARVRGVAPASLFALAQVLRDVFDTDAPVDEIAAVLSGEPLLAAELARTPGIRAPGAWNRFELLVRAILGQQISVAAATTFAGRIAERYGEPLPAPLVAASGLKRAFPPAEKLVRARLENLGIVAARAATIRRVARAMHTGTLVLDASADRGTLRDALMSVKGIGAWTAEYVLMRAMKDPDAFPAADLGLLKGATPEGADRPTPRQLEEQSKDWRPWRAYAALLLWQRSASGG